tara:strand:+ start:2096 stop:3712 length:1617 start_codon:yes stop_codon:yes gene_type:complete
MKLRDYQQRSIDMLYDWLPKNEGNPCLVLPTGSGKSHIVAALCKDALTQWPDTRVLMLTHVKELIEQNAEKMREHWKGAPMGIYSAGLGKKNLEEPITFAGIQSIRNKSAQLGHIDIIIVDECHLISHKDEGGYRGLINDLTAINPAIRVVGLTATPYRLGHGYIDEEGAVFDDRIEPVTIEELIHKGHLSILRSKSTEVSFDVSSVHRRGGEYIEKELQAAVNNTETNSQVINEVISRAVDRRHWLFFCTGVDHAEHISEVLKHKGIKSACITGKTPAKERADIIRQFKAGEIKALTNANVLTTGFDFPDIDCVVMLRPTLSPALYMQMAGRGLRPKSHIKDCLVLDFAGNVSIHGPITRIKPPQKSGGGGEAPIKVCDNCHEIVHASVMTCPECGFKFPESENLTAVELHDDCIMGSDSILKMNIASWQWAEHTSRAGDDMLKVTYYAKSLSVKPITEYFCINHAGYAGQKALAEVNTIAHASGCHAELIAANGLHQATLAFNHSLPPAEIQYEKNGRFFNVTGRNYEAQNTADSE